MLASLRLGWLRSRRAGAVGAALGVVTAVFTALVALISFTSWSPPDWSRVAIGVVPVFTWAASIVFSVIGWRQHQRWALLGFACCAASVIALIAMVNVAY